MSDVVERTLGALPALLGQHEPGAGPGGAGGPHRPSASSRLGSLIRNVTALTSKHVRASCSSRGLRAGPLSLSESPKRRGPLRWGGGSRCSPPSRQTAPGAPQGEGRAVPRARGCGTAGDSVQRVPGVVLLRVARCVGAGTWAIRAEAETRCVALVPWIRYALFLRILSPTMWMCVLWLYFFKSYLVSEDYTELRQV